MIRTVRNICFLGLLTVMVSACGAIPPQMISGDNISTSHGTARGMDAFKGAKAYCSSRGKGVKTVRSDCPFKCVTVYQCVTQ